MDEQEKKKKKNFAFLKHQADISIHGIKQEAKAM